MAPTNRDSEDVNGLVCFLNQNRPCGADCMAYLPASERPQGVEYAEAQWASCLLLVNAHRTGKHLVVLAGSAADAVKLKKDGARMGQQAPPAVK